MQIVFQDLEKEKKIIIKFQVQNRIHLNYYKVNILSIRIYMIVIFTLNDI